MCSLFFVLPIVFLDGESSRDSHSKPNSLTLRTQQDCYSEGAVRGTKQRGPLDCRIKQKEENMMEETTRSEPNNALEMLCEQAKHMVLSGNIDGCYEMICHFMGKYPNAPHLHNLLGILSEKKGRHAEAMKHFRAALALDPTYSPASQNLDTYGSFYSTGRCAFHEADCIAESEKTSNTCASTGFIVRRAV